MLTGFVEVETLPFLGIKFEELNLDQKAELLFLDQRYTDELLLLGSFCNSLEWIQPFDLF